MTTHNHNIVGAQLRCANRSESPSKARLLRGIGIALAALFLAAPNTTLADNECGLQTLPGMSETLTCAPGDYDGAGTNPGPGITYSSDGDLTLQVTDDSDHLDVFETGIDVTGNGGDSVFWDSSALVDNDIRGTGIVLDYASGTGAVDILIGGDVRAESDGTHAIRAISDSGDVTVQTNEGGRIFGGYYGIQAETGGSGTLDIVVGDSIGIDSTTGVAAIDATTGTGLLTIDLVSTGVSDTVNGQSATAIRANAGGDLQIDIGDGRSVSMSSGGTALDLTAADSITVNNAGTIGIGAVGTNAAIIAEADSLVLDNAGTIRGEIDFSEVTGGYVFNNNAGAVWRDMGAFNDLGEGVINNAGTLRFDQGDVVSALGSTFTGSGDSLLEMFVFLDGTGQSGCSAATVASCLDLSGGETAGRTDIEVFVQFSTLVARQLGAATTANSGIVLVDVGGGTSADGHFVLSQDSRAVIDGTPVFLYAEDPVYGAVLDLSWLGIGSGILDYALLYNPGTQQHVLASVPQREAVEYVAYIQESLSIWHSTSDAVVGRQADLRDGATGRVWFRYRSDSTERDAAPTSTIQGNTFTYDQSYTQDTDTAIVGFDAISGERHVLGVHGGMIKSRLEHDDSVSRDESKGVTVGVYGGWWNEAGLTLDGVVNANALSLNHDMPEGFEETESDVISLGVRAEAGWRLPLMDEALYVQPLATAAYVNADIDQVDLQDNELSFEDSQSLRAALGVRLGGESALNAGLIDRIGYWVTARAWEEQIEDGEVRFATGDGGHLAITDDRSGSFEEINLGVSVSNEDDTVSGYLSGGATSGDDVDTYNVSIGARLNW